MPLGRTMTVRESVAEVNEFVSGATHAKRENTIRVRMMAAIIILLIVLSKCFLSIKEESLLLFSLRNHSLKLY